jgi:hypothetical protein
MSAFGEGLLSAFQGAVGAADAYIKEERTFNRKQQGAMTLADYQHQKQLELEKLRQEFEAKQDANKTAARIAEIEVGAAHDAIAEEKAREHESAESALDRENRLEEERIRQEGKEGGKDSTTTLNNVKKAGEQALTNVMKTAYDAAAQELKLRVPDDKADFGWFVDALAVRPEAKKIAEQLRADWSDLQGDLAIAKDAEKIQKLQQDFAAKVERLMGNLIKEEVVPKQAADAASRPPAAEPSLLGGMDQQSLIDQSADSGWRDQARQQYGLNPYSGE